MPAFKSPSFDDVPAAFCFHTGSKAVSSNPFFLAWLVGSFCAHVG